MLELFKTPLLAGRLALATLLLAATIATTSCSDDDEPGGSGLDYTGQATSHYRVDYIATLNDEHVLDIADVLISWRDSLGQLRHDTMRSGSWVRSVNMARATSVDCTLAAQFKAKPDISPNRAEYDFSLSLASPFYRVYANGTSGYLLHIHDHSWAGILGNDSTQAANTTRTADFIATEAGRQAIDNTAAYYNVTMRVSGSQRDSIAQKPLELASIAAAPAE